MITVDEAVRQWREDPQMAALVRDADLDRDVHAAASRFLESEEFAEVKHLLRNKSLDGTVVDLGAGAEASSSANFKNSASNLPKSPMIFPPKHQFAVKRIVVIDEQIADTFFVSPFYGKTAARKILRTMIRYVKN